MDVAKKYRIYERLRLGIKVQSIMWSDQTKKWRINLTDVKTGVSSEMECDFLVSGIGGLHVPLYPKVPGVRESFKGEETHTAEYDTSVQVKDKRVVVVGSAASAVQLCPVFAQDASKLTIVQRTPNWLAPQRNFTLPFSLKYGPIFRFILRYFPGALRLYRWIVYWSMEILHTPLGVFMADGGIVPMIARKILTMYMQLGLKYNKDLASKVIPDFQVGCKRIIRSEKFLPMLLQDNVELVSGQLVQVIEDGVLVAEKNGSERKIECDTLVYATGYQVGSIGDCQVHGNHNLVVKGASMIDEARDNFFSVCLRDMPNAFFLLGPNAALGHQSAVVQIETAANYAARVIELAMENKVKRLEIKQAEIDRSMSIINSYMEKSVWFRGDCASWYKNKDGKVPTLWPASTVRFMWDLAPPSDLRSFDCE